MRERRFAATDSVRRGVFLSGFGAGSLAAGPLVLAALGLLAQTPPTQAQGIDLSRGGPIQITAQEGIEWRQTEQMVVARGSAQAVRGGVTVTADRLIAWYRRRGGEAPAAAAGPAAAPVPASPTPASPMAVTADTSTQGNEVYRLRAEGNVHIFTRTDQAWGDQATYDLDQAVLVMTGRNLKLTTPNDTLTARDTLEYWSQKQMAVARGDAVVVTNDARRVAADTLVAFTNPSPPPPGTAAPAGTAKPSAARMGEGVGGDGMAAMAGRLERVEAFNNVSVRTVTDIVTGDRAVYVPDTGIARLGGHVRISRGMNQINGSEAVVNMKTGIATLLAGGSGRVTGVVMPNDPSNKDSAGDPLGGSPGSGSPGASSPGGNSPGAKDAPGKTPAKPGRQP